MKNIEPIKVYKLILDLAWYISIVVICLWSMVNVVSIAFDGVVRVGDLLTITVQQKSSNANPFKLSNDFNFKITKQPETAIQLTTFKVNQIAKPIVWFSMISIAIGLIFSFWQLKLLREFLANIIAKKIFVQENVKKLNRIALIEFASIPLTICYYFAMGVIVKNDQMLNVNYEFITD